ncbi:MAG: peptidyl-prolyl cis-trans isomerase D [Myxococcota bacterium]|jgi:peptidyl-prolyl cis-trans isomerase D
MALLETIRQQTDSPWAKIVFGAVVLVFVFWGVGASGGPTTTAIAEVNGNRITDTELHRQMRNISRSQGASQNDDDLNRQAADVIQQLIQTEVLLQEVDRTGIEVSDQEIVRELKKIDAFQTSDGKFSTELYERNLKNIGLTRGRFEDQLRDSIALEKLETLAKNSVTISDASLERLYRQVSTELNVSFVRIPNAALLGAVPVEDSSIDALIASDLETLKEAYQRDFSRLYHKDPTAELQTVLLKTDIEGVTAEELDAKMAEILAEAKSGADFSQLARRYSEDLSAVNGGALGAMAKPQVDPAAVEAIFAAPNALTAAIKTAQGLQIFKVGAITQEETIPFEDVQRDIARNQLAEQGVSKVAGEFAEELLATWKTAGTPPSDRLEQHGLRLSTPPSTSKGAPNLPGTGGSEGLIAALNTAKQAGVLDGVYPTDGGRLIASIDAITAPDMDAFEEQKDMIRAQVLRQEQEVFLAAWRDDLLSKARIVQHYDPMNQ